MLADKKLYPGPLVQVTGQIGATAIALSKSLAEKGVPLLEAVAVLSKAAQAERCSEIAAILEVAYRLELAEHVMRTTARAEIRDVKTAFMPASGADAALSGKWIYLFSFHERKMTPEQAVSWAEVYAASLRPTTRDDCLPLRNADLAITSHGRTGGLGANFNVVAPEPLSDNSDVSTWRCHLLVRERGGNPVESQVRYKGPLPGASSSDYNLYFAFTSR